MLFLATRQFLSGDFIYPGVLYAIAFLLCAARVFNYSWKYIDLSIHILFVVLSLFYLEPVWMWLTEATPDDQAITGAKAFLQVTFGAVTMFYQYKVAKV